MQLIRIVAVLFLVLTVFSALRRLLAPAPPQERRQGRAPDGGKLVRDPVCGTYVAASQSIAASKNAETYHFCSEECREKFLHPAS